MDKKHDAQSPAAPQEVVFTVDCSKSIDDVLPADRRWTIANAIALVAAYRNCASGETKEVMQRFADYMRAALADAAAPAQSAEPVAWMTEGKYPSPRFIIGKKDPSDVWKEKYVPLYAAPQPSLPAVVLDDERAAGVLQHALDWISHQEHGDNCFVSSHYPGDPGDRCNCGKDSVMHSIETALEGWAASPQWQTEETIKSMCRWRDLYDAINQVTAVLGCHGSISAPDDRVMHLMECLKSIDGGEYTPGMMPLLVYAKQPQAAPAQTRTLTDEIAVLKRLQHVLVSGRAYNGIENDRAEIYANALEALLAAQASGGDRVE